MIRTMIAGGVLFSIMVAVSCFFVYSYRVGMGCVSSPFHQKKNVCVFAIWAIFLIGFCYHMSSQNQFVYYWDLGGYWTKCYELMAVIFQHPLQGLREVVHSVNTSEYNLLLPLFLALPLKIVGISYASYVTAITGIFLVPSIFIIISICWKLLPLQDRTFSAFACILLAATSFSPLYMASFYGYYDAGCLILVGLAVLLTIDYDIVTWNKEQMRRNVLIAILLTAAFFFRRYFAYVFLGYMGMLLIQSLTMIYLRHEGSRKAMACCAARNLFMIGGTAGFLLFICYQEMMKKILTTNYAQQYAAYNLPLFKKFSLTEAGFGHFFCLLALVALLLSWQDDRFQKMVIFAAGMVCIIASVFFHVQAMAPQHMYILCVPMFLLFVIGGHTFLHLGTRWKKSRAGILLFCMIVGVLHSFNIALQNLPEQMSGWYSSFVFQPLVRSDLKELHDMADTLNEASDQSGANVYVLASGDTLNAGIMDAMDKPEREHAVHRLCPTNDVDLRDGFPQAFLTAGFIVVTTPVDLHLAPGSQEVVRFLAEEVQNPKSPVGRHFVRYGRTFLLDHRLHGGVGSYFVKEKENTEMQAYIYRKTDEFTHEDLAYIANYFDEQYPGRQGLFGERILSGGE